MNLPRVYRLVLANDNHSLIHDDSMNLLNEKDTLKFLYNPKDKIVYVNDRIDKSKIPVDYNFMIEFSKIELSSFKNHHVILNNEDSHMIDDIIRMVKNSKNTTTTTANSSTFSEIDVPPTREWKASILKGMGLVHKNNHRNTLMSSLGGVNIELEDGRPAIPLDNVDFEQPLITIDNE